MSRRPRSTDKVKAHTKISQLRKEAGWTQEELATKLSDYIGRDERFSISTISSWEQGRKTPSMPVLIGIAEMFSVPIEELLGTNDLQNIRAQNSSLQDGAAQPIVQSLDANVISPIRYGEYHAKPVFIVFANKKMPDQWGIMNCAANAITLMNGTTVSLSEPNIELHALQSYDTASYYGAPMRAISIQRMFELNQVWVEMLTDDAEIRAIYNGWYVHNSNRSALISTATGISLPYRGYGISYRAYTNPRYEA